MILRAGIWVGVVPKATSRSGLTLTEIAIVLGLVGLVLGAIWTATALVYTRYRTSILVRDINYILTQLSFSQSFSNGDFPANAACQSQTTSNPGGGSTTTYYGSSGNDGTGALLNSAAVPPDMIYGPAGVQTLKDAFGGQFTMSFLSAGSCTSGTGNAPSASVDHQLTFTMDNVPTTACVWMLTQNKAQWSSYGFMQICTNGCGGGNYYFGTNNPSGLTQDMINASCTASDPVSLQLYFDFWYTYSRVGPGN